VFSKDDQLPDNIEDEIAPLLRRITTGKFWNGERARAFAQLSEALAERKYLMFQGHYLTYHLTRKGQSCLYDVPLNQRGALSRFRGKQIRLVCMGGWDAYGGRYYYAGDTSLPSNLDNGKKL
jgi:hypothetical protein